MSSEYQIHEALQEAIQQRLKILKSKNMIKIIIPGVLWWNIDN